MNQLFARIIREARLRRKDDETGRAMSQETVAKLAGTYQETICNLESGRVNVTGRHLQQIAGALGVSVRRLILEELREEAARLSAVLRKKAKAALDEPDVLDETGVLAHVMRNLRLRSGMTQQELGHKIGLPQNLISMRESAGTEIDEDVLGSVARAVGMCLEEALLIGLLYEPPVQDQTGLRSRLQTAYGRVKQRAVSAGTQIHESHLSRFAAGKRDLA